jgi:hypothetical protein
LIVTADARLPDAKPWLSSRTGCQMLLGLLLPGLALVADGSFKA